MLFYSLYVQAIVSRHSKDCTCVKYITTNVSRALHTKNGNGKKPENGQNGRGCLGRPLNRQRSVGLSFPSTKRASRILAAVYKAIITLSYGVQIRQIRNRWKADSEYNSNSKLYLKSDAFWLSNGTFLILFAHHMGKLCLYFPQLFLLKTVVFKRKQTAPSGSSSPLGPSVQTKKLLFPLGT